jgi:hypothetical protein
MVSAARMQSSTITFRRIERVAAGGYHERFEGRVRTEETEREAENHRAGNTGGASRR